MLCAIAALAILAVIMFWFAAGMSWVGQATSGVGFFARVIVWMAPAALAVAAVECFAERNRKC